MKITRQNLAEDWKSSRKADWIEDFSRDLEKNADFLDNLRTVIQKRKEFNSIEEKMADMKERAGFALIKDIPDNPAQSKVATDDAATCSCEKKNCQKCNPDLFRSLKSIITYIKALSKDRKDIGLLGIITHCRQHPTLEFQRIEGLIDGEKFKALVKDIIGDKSDKEEVKYIPEETSSEVDGAGDMADYMAHANPG